MRSAGSRGSATTRSTARSRSNIPAARSRGSAYDAVGNLVALTRPDGKTITFTYDAMNRLVRKSLPGGAQVDYTYQPDGQRATVTDARGVTAYAYDSIGRLASVTHPGGEVVKMTRDANGNLKSLASPAATIGYDYDALNRLVQVDAPEGQSRSYYDLVGNRVRDTLANGMATDAVFDARNRVTQLAHRAPGNAVLRSFANGYSPAGRRTQTTEDDGSITTFGYDAKGRLVSESRTGAAPYVISHVYDAVGNRTQLTGPVGPVAFTYDSNDRLLSRGATTYGYDTNGNRVALTNGANVTQYGFDAEDRLVMLRGPGVANEYTYDADGTLVQSNGAAGITRFLPDRSNNSRLSQVLEERDGGGLPTRALFIRQRAARDGTRRSVQRLSARQPGERARTGRRHWNADRSVPVRRLRQRTFGGRRLGKPVPLHGRALRRRMAACTSFVLASTIRPPGGSCHATLSVGARRVLFRYIVTCMRMRTRSDFNDPTGRETLLNITLTQSAEFVRRFEYRAKGRAAVVYRQRNGRPGAVAGRYVAAVRGHGRSCRRRRVCLRPRYRW